MSSRHASHVKTTSSHAKTQSGAKKPLANRSAMKVDACLPWSYRQSFVGRVLICAVVAILTAVCGTLIHRFGSQYNVPIGLVLALAILAIATWSARARSGIVGVAIQLMLSTLVAGFFANFNGDILVPVGFRTTTLSFFSQYVGLFWLGGLIVIPIVCILLPSNWFVIPESVSLSKKGNMAISKSFDNTDNAVEFVVPVASTVPVALDASTVPPASTASDDRVVSVASPTSVTFAGSVISDIPMASAAAVESAAPVTSYAPVVSTPAVEVSATSNSAVIASAPVASHVPVASAEQDAPVTSAVPVVVAAPAASIVPVASPETTATPGVKVESEASPALSVSAEPAAPVVSSTVSEPVESSEFEASQGLVELVATAASAASAGFVGPMASVPSITPVKIADSDTLAELTPSTVPSTSAPLATAVDVSKKHDAVSSTPTTDADADNQGIYVPTLAASGLMGLKNTDKAVTTTDNPSKTDSSCGQTGRKIVTDEMDIVTDAASAQHPSDDFRTLLFLGPQGSFTHQAAVNAANALTEQGIAVRLEARNDVQSIIHDVEAGQGWGVIAWENSIEGSVMPNLDAMIDAHNVAGLGRLSIDVSFDAFVRADEGNSANLSPYATLNQVVAHPHGLAQCARFVREHQLTPVPAASNAAACRDILPGQVALGPALCGPLYGLKTLAHKVQDFDGANTDFLIVAARDDVNQVLKSSRQIGVSDYETIIAVAPLSTGPGVMAKLLDRLRDEGLNMTSLMSRPIKGNAGTYSFIITLDAAPWQRGFKHFLSQLVAEGDWVKTLAVYLRRDRPNPPVDTWMLPQGGVCSKRSAQNESGVNSERELLW
jgi:chorismate mutase / prephenate dehydratase